MPTGAALPSWTWHLCSSVDFRLALSPLPNQAGADPRLLSKLVDLPARAVRDPPKDLGLDPCSCPPRLHRPALQASAIYVHRAGDGVILTLPAFLDIWPGGRHGTAPACPLPVTARNAHGPSSCRAAALGEAAGRLSPSRRCMRKPNAPLASRPGALEPDATGREMRGRPAWGTAASRLGGAAAAPCRPSRGWRPRRALPPPLPSAASRPRCRALRRKTPSAGLFFEPYRGRPAKG